MVASKHHYSGIRQFIRDKTTRFGLKLWILADSITDYTYAFFVYLGKKRTELNYRTKGLAHNAVMELSKKLVNQGYRIYTDSFYTTQHLATDLLQKKTYLIGAVKRISSAMPQCLKDIELFLERCPVTVLMWTFSILNHNFPIHKGSSIGQCQRTVNERSGYKEKVISQPLIVQDYNTNMGGVQKIQPNVKQVSMLHQINLSLVESVVFHCIDIMVVNSYIPIKEFMMDKVNES